MSVDGARSNDRRCGFLSELGRTILSRVFACSPLDRRAKIKPFRDSSLVFGCAKHACLVRMLNQPFMHHRPRARYI
eukprot:1321722-Prymnesium_polylepis.1